MRKEVKCLQFSRVSHASDGWEQFGVREKGRKRVGRESREKERLEKGQSAGGTRNRRIGKGRWNRENGGTMRSKNVRGGWEREIERSRKDRDGSREAW